MTIKDNNWGGAYAQITWLERFLKGHKNIVKVNRTKDILFEVDRIANKDKLLVLCLDEYVMSFTAVQKVIERFGRVHIIYIGGGWCSYTEQAKDYCIQNNIGLYVTEEMTGAIWSEKYWSYHRKNRDGDPMYHYGRK